MLITAHKTLHVLLMGRALYCDRGEMGGVFKASQYQVLWKLNEISLFKLPYLCSYVWLSHGLTCKTYFTHEAGFLIMMDLLPFN